MKKISPFLWFDHNAEEAVKFYTSDPTRQPMSIGSSSVWKMLQVHGRQLGEQIRCTCMKILPMASW
uniref:PhnB-like domain-containing protein n=1 Tax=candidate division WWE3 bacterium TaxID=2053526 RepID=A0A7C4XV97_UNCKA